MSLEEELALVARAKAGEKEAMGILWSSITPKLYGYLVNVLREKSLAEDILQETWLKAISALPSFRPRGARFSAWLFAIAKNECRQYWRSHHQNIILEDGEEETIPDHAAAPAVMQEKLLLDNVLEKLSKTDREILRLRYISDLSFKEIARVLELSVIVARVRAHRALGRARAVLENNIQ